MSLLNELAEADRAAAAVRSVTAGTASAGSKELRPAALYTMCTGGKNLKRALMALASGLEKQVRGFLLDFIW